MADTPMLPDVFERKARAPQPEYTNRVHRIGHPCTLFGWFCRTHWQLKRQPGTVLLRIFDEGHRWHRRVAAAMAEAGVEYVRQEEAMFWPDLQLSGHMDGLVMACSQVSQLAEGETAVVDAKGMSDYAWQSLDSLDDLINSKHWYHRAYVVQPALYAVHPQVAAEWACIYAIKRSTSEVKQLWWRPEEVIEQIVVAKKSCRAINDAIAEDARQADGEPLVPAHLAGPGTWCDDCDFQAVCPEFKLQSAGIVIATQEIIELVDEREQLVDSFRRYNRITDQLKQHWENAGAGEYICGDTVAVVKQVDEKQVAAKPAHTRAAYTTTRYRPLDKGSK